MKRCKACVNDMKHQTGGGYTPLPDVHRAARPWWEREPGWAKAEAKAEIARAGRQWWPRIGGRDLRNVIPIHSMTQKQLVAELKRQSARLAGQPSFEEAA